MSLGSDFSGFDDLDPRLTFLEGDANEITACAQAVARRFITPRGGLFYDQSYGLDLRAFLSDTANPDLVAKQICAEARKEQRVTDCAASITVNGDTWTVVINPSIDTGRSFTLTLAVSAVTVELLTVANNAYA